MAIRTMSFENVRFDLKVMRDAIKRVKLKIKYFCILAKMQN